MHEDIEKKDKPAVEIALYELVLYSASTPKTKKKVWRVKTLYKLPVEKSTMSLDANGASVKISFGAAYLNFSEGLFISIPHRNNISSDGITLPAELRNEEDKVSKEEYSVKLERGYYKFEIQTKVRTKRSSTITKPKKKASNEERSYDIILKKFAVQQEDMGRVCDAVSNKFKFPSIIPAISTTPAIIDESLPSSAMIPITTMPVTPMAFTPSISTEELMAYIKAEAEPTVQPAEGTAMSGGDAQFEFLQKFLLGDGLAVPDNSATTAPSAYTAPDGATTVPVSWMMYTTGQQNNIRK